MEHANIELELVSKWPWQNVCTVVWDRQLFVLSVRLPLECASLDRVYTYFPGLLSHSLEY